MPSLDILIPFFLATAIFACIPGPGLLYAAARTMSHGRRAGWLAALGLHVGGYAHILATAFGLAALLAVVPALYLAVKVAGAAYLVWLGYRMLAADPSAPGPHAAAGVGTPRGALVQSILVEILNPKTALFYLSFLAQFTDPAAGYPVWLQVVVLGVVVNLMFTLTDIACVLLSDRIVRALAASTVVNRVARRLGGGILIVLGANLALSRQ